jgi:hypothetical protein
MTAEDVELRVRQQTDPQMMAELGGPRPREAIERAHAKSLALAAEGRCWPLKIVLDGATSPAGVVDVFASSHQGETFYEIGWMILPEFQHRGIAARQCGRSWRRRGRSGSSGRSMPFPRSRTDRPVLNPGAGCEDSACHEPTPSRTASGCRRHSQWHPGQAETAPRAARTAGPQERGRATPPRGRASARSDTEPASEAGGRMGVGPGLYDDPHRRSLTGGGHSSSRSLPRPVPRCPGEEPSAASSRSVRRRTVA